MKQIAPIELQSLQQQTEVFLLDVREPFEHEAFNLGGTLIPLGEVMRKATEIPRDKPVVIYCKKGIRSQLAIQRLADKFGFDNLVNLEGGVEGWQKMDRGLR